MATASPPTRADAFVGRAEELQSLDGVVGHGTHFHVDDGRIVEAWMTWDSLSLLEQLGAIARVETVSA